MEYKNLITAIKAQNEKILRILRALEKNRNYLKLRKSTIRFIAELERLVEVFWSPKLSIDDREKILMEISDPSATLVKSTLILYRTGHFGFDDITRVSIALSALGYFNLVTSLLNDSLWKEETFSNLATIADIGYETGILEESLKAIDKLQQKGYNFLELGYNKALILYMLGKDVESLNIIEELERRFGPKKTLFGLKIAALIANNSFDEANRLSRIRRSN